MSFAAGDVCRVAMLENGFLAIHLLCINISDRESAFLCMTMHQQRDLAEVETREDTNRSINDRPIANVVRWLKHCKGFYSSERPAIYLG